MSAPMTPREALNVLTLAYANGSNLAPSDSQTREAREVLLRTIEQHEEAMLCTEPPAIDAFCACAECVAIRKFAVVVQSELTRGNP